MEFLGFYCNKQHPSQPLGLLFQCILISSIPLFFKLETRTPGFFFLTLHMGYEKVLENVAHLSGASVLPDEK